MIYIATEELEGRGVYFDTHSVERSGRGVRVCGTVGDGCYEGEVLIEVGGEAEVTFVDQWLGSREAVSFLSRCGADRLRAALVEAALEMPLVRGLRSDEGGRQPLPHVHLPLFSAAGLIAEDVPGWCRKG